MAPTPPRVFRILLPVRDLAKARGFYRALLGADGRAVTGGRVYFDCGPVILGLLDTTTEGAATHAPPTEAIYLATDDLERVHARAKRLGCLSRELLHDDPASPLGAIVTRPWGERSFYVEDPWGTPLCFVDARTVFTGSRSQIRRLRSRSVRAQRSRRRGPRPG